jgi:hypothetical protein
MAVGGGMISHSVNASKLSHCIHYFIIDTCVKKHIRRKPKLYKLLYVLDFTHFKETGRSVTGTNYYARTFGPVPTYTYDGHGYYPPFFLPIIFNDKYFTKRELRLLEKVANVFDNSKDADIEESLFLSNRPWEKTLQTKGDGAVIDYMLAIDDTENSLSMDEVIERIKDRHLIKKAFC